MKLTQYERLDEAVYRQTLPCGLQILVVPKAGFSRKTAYLITDFGSIHQSFTLDGQHYDTPAGVAHYLEHKVFDMPGRDIMEEFSVLGAGVNAFTSYDLTAYYFSATENFEDSLRLLLEFVTTPYFTEESVEKERGIIDQEIGMYWDDPNSRVFDNLMAALYHHHPIRVPILGTQESIRQITAQTLHLCHRAFYVPSNMVLCVVGDISPEGVCRIASDVLGTERRSCGIKDPIPKEPESCREQTVSVSMDIPMPTFYLGFKCPPTGLGLESARREMVADLAAEVLFGESSSLYLKMYESGLIDSSFGGGYETTDEGAILSCGGDSDEPKAVLDEILAQARILARDGITEADFQRIKRSAIGRRIRDLDSFSATCFRLGANVCDDFDYFRFPEVYETITAEDIRVFLDENIHTHNCSISIITPCKEDEL